MSFVPMTDYVTSTGAHVKKINGLIQCAFNAAGDFYGTDVKTDSLNLKPQSCFFLSVSHPLSISLCYGQCISRFKIKPCPGLLNKSAWQCLLTSTLWSLILYAVEDKKQITEGENISSDIFFICFNWYNNQDFDGHRQP